MKRRTVLAGLAAGLVSSFTIIGCSEMPSMPSWMPGSGWTTLIDGEKGLENFDRSATPTGAPKAARSSPTRPRTAATW